MMYLPKTTLQKGNVTLFLPNTTLQKGNVIMYLPNISFENSKQLWMCKLSG